VKKPKPIIIINEDSLGRKTEAISTYDAKEIDTYLSSIADVERIADIVGENSSFKCLCRTVGGVQYTCDRCKECEKIAQEISDHIKGNK